VIGRIAELEAGEREAALGQLMIVAGLRKLGQVVEEEARKMPILNDILEHEVLGREYKKGLQQGLQEGLQQGVQRGELMVLRRQIEKRFGTIPNWAEERLLTFPAHELENLSVRVLEANSIEELLR
jgi:flagellar biosynthesis/type III secretory pathway protein FliH